MSTPSKTSQQSEMDKLRQELLNDPKVRIGANVLHDFQLEKQAPTSAEIEDARASGMNAWDTFRDVSDNPYNHHTLQWAWLEGWHFARRMRE